MLHDDLKWKNSFDTFCLENNIQGGKKDQLTLIYGRAVFAAISSRIYHGFIKQSLCDFYKDIEIDETTLSTYIHHLSHEDLFSVPQTIEGSTLPLLHIIQDPTFAFKAIGDGSEIATLPLDTPKTIVESMLGTKENIVCLFKIPDYLKGLKETMLGDKHLHKGTELYTIIEQSKSIPSSFHIDWKRQENNIYKVTDSLFIR